VSGTDPIPASGDRRSGVDTAILFIAEGFGSGRMPVGPGTWGSLLGVGWLVLLLRIPDPIWATLAALLAVGIAIPICSRAERILGREDPGSVVLDEIVAVPLTFLGPLIVLGTWPLSSGVADLAHRFWPEWVVGFLAFRLFDIAKPGLIRRVQNLHSGWGVVADDILAALAAALVTAIPTFLHLPR
jgi:phosphatidylglycerophosphatase A